MKKVLFLFSVIALLSCEKETIQPKAIEQQIEVKYELVLENIPTTYFPKNNVYLIYGDNFRSRDTCINITSELKYNELTTRRITLPFKPNMIVLSFVTRVENGKEMGYNSTFPIQCGSLVTVYRFHDTFFRSL